MKRIIRKFSARGTDGKIYVVDVVEGVVETTDSEDESPRFQRGSIEFQAGGQPINHIGESKGQIVGTDIVLMSPEFDTHSA